jgi:hypothetical protein
MRDRATVVAHAAMEMIIATLHKKFCPQEFYEKLEQMLRDEFADEQRQAMADRELPDA